MAAASSPAPPASSSGGGAAPSSTPPPKAYSILFVCLGNICRSPLAEAVFSAHHGTHPLVAHVSSAGTAAYHVGRPPDPRTQAVLAAHGVADFAHAARQVCDADFTDFDWIVAMDRDNLTALRFVRERILYRRRRAPRAVAAAPAASDDGREDVVGERRRDGDGRADEERRAGDPVEDEQVGIARLALFGNFEPGTAPGRGEEVKDPYYGGKEGFEVAYQQVVRLSKGLVARLEEETRIVAGT
jgi:low molecular weight phosphotyrosine protein phosphatase